MSSPAGRLLDLLSLLQSRPRWNAAELAERLHTTERTVRRDVARLRDLGYPVDAELGRAGGYQLGAGGALPPLLLSDDEAVAVAVGLRAAATTGGVVGYEDAAVAALAKLEQVLPARLRDRVLSLNTAAVVVRSGTDGNVQIDPELLLLLAQACRRAERAHFGYLDRAGNATERRVEPYRLVNVEHRWYLVAHDLDRSDWRTFRLDRMSDAVLTGHRFERGEEPDAGELVTEGMALAGYRWRAELVLHAGLEQASWDVPRTIGFLEPIDDERTLLRLGADSLEWIARLVAGLPFDAEVVSPKELRAALRAHARRLAQQHRG
jgi:predicted DNA-binding transcriptional regulator YafY